MHRLRLFQIDVKLRRIEQNNVMNMQIGHAVEEHHVRAIVGVGQEAVDPEVVALCDVCVWCK